ncbi:MAG: DUF6259 domain-containing protein [Acidobacteriaceae bacterium]
MNRRDFLVQSSRVAAVTALSGQQMFGEASGQSAYSGEVRLEDDELLIVFDAGSGALIRLERKSTGWILQRRPELGVSFRLLVPLPHRRDNFVLGQKQRAFDVKKLSDHHLHLQWKHLVSEHGGVLPMTFTAVVTLDHGTLTFDSTLINDSPLTVETIDYPYLGDLNAPTQDTPMRSEHMWYGNLVGDELLPEFSNEKGYWGVDFPTKTIESKQSLFCLIQTPREGVYVEMHDPTQPYLLEDTFELHPGVVQSVNDTVPRGDAISGIPVHLEFRTCHFIFAPPKSTRKLVPVVLRCYSGDWHAGVDLYKEWRATWFQKPHVAAWVTDVHSWQQLQVNTPEQDYSIPYRNLKKYIDECANNGVGAIQLVGWNIGGQDGGDPSLDTDPGLGTWQQLHDVIVYAQKKGVKMILFGKLNWADMTTEWFRKELYKYSATDPYGIPYQQDGYSYITPTQLAGINNHRREVMDFLCPAYRDIATRQLEKILALGAAGWLFDEVCHHGPVEYSFSSDHGYAPPGYIYAGDLPMSRQLRAAADKVNPEFIFAGEGPQDWLMQYYPVSYFRINRGSRAVCRYIDSTAPLVVAVTGVDDREMLNLILMNRYIISYEPYNFKGHVTDFPLTLAYGKKIDALRRKYKSYLWDAEFRDTLDASVSSDGVHCYSVFVKADGKRAVVVVNEKSDATITATVQLPNPGKLAVVTPELTEPQPTSGTLQIPARSAAVLLEL